ITKFPVGSGEMLTVTETDKAMPSKGKVHNMIENLWLTRTGGPAKPSKVLIAAFSLEPQNLIDSQVQFLPGTGDDGVYHVVYKSEGDLKVVEIVPGAARAGGSR
ncbi:MAG TPA: hypothetical protein VFW40_03255, partial [Capsulimonadaceae bacterium]|nr:hypothetical protein [Capsulimonadaceae bacterium]